MAVDKKSSHVGNHGGTYTDMNGMTKQFTYIDHDKKTKISTNKMTDKEKKKVSTDLSAYRVSLQDRILCIPASVCPWEFHDFTIRNEKTPEILWNEVMVRDEGISIDRLRELCTLTERRFDLNFTG